MSSTTSLTYLVRLRSACAQMERSEELLAQLVAEAGQRGWRNDRNRLSRLRVLTDSIARLSRDTQELALDAYFERRRRTAVA